MENTKEKILCKYCLSTTTCCDDVEAETCENYPKEEPKYISIIEKMKPLQEQWQKDMEKSLNPKQETLEEAARDYIKGDDLSTFTQRAFFIAGAKWQAERMYSEEDMRNAFDSAREFNSLDGVVDVHIVLPMGGDMSDLQPLHFTFDDYFEQFKKK